MAGPTPQQAPANLESLPSSSDINAENDKPEKNGTIPEDFIFIDFAKRYIGLLATVMSVPILASIIGVLSPPAQNERLSLLSSFICLLAFAACFLLKGPLGKMASSRHDGWRFMPFAMVCLVVCFAIFLTAFYIAYAPTQPFVQIICYLAIYPLFVSALGIILVTSFTQQRSQSIQSIVDARLQEKQKDLLKNIQNYARFHELAQRASPLRSIGDELIRRHDEQLSKLSHGQVEVIGTETTHIQYLLLKYFHKRFDAVSDRDLDFWVLKDDHQIAQGYIQLLREAISRGTTVTRIFIVAERDLTDRYTEIVSVLKNQQADGVGWALAIYEGLSPTTMERGIATDFALFEDRDGKKAASFFREYRELTRRFMAVFQTPDNEYRIKQQEEQYKRILSQCLLVNGTFKEQRQDILAEPTVPQRSTQREAEEASITSQIKKNTDTILQRSGFAKDSNFSGSELFLLEVTSTDEIEQKVKWLREAWCKSKQALSLPTLPSVNLADHATTPHNGAKEG